MIAPAAAQPALTRAQQALDASTLQDLHDIIAAPAPSWWPPAPGWWLLAATVLLALAALWPHAKRRWRRRRQRREALHRLDALYRDLNAGGSPPAYAAALSALLKRAALTRRPRAEVAALTGAAWSAYLCEARRGGLPAACGELLIRLQYQPQPAASDAAREREALRQLHLAAARWLRHNL